MEISIVRLHGTVESNFRVFYRSLKLCSGTFKAHKRKVLMRINLVIVLMTGAILQASAISHAQEISLSKQNASLISVIREIQAQSSYDFVYSTRVLKKAKNISISVANVSLEEALEKCFRNQPFTYTLKNKTIIIKENDRILPAIGLEKRADIIGKVVDENGVPLIGVSVKLKGSISGTSTNNDGNFTINTPDEGGTLVFTYIGFAQQEVTTNGRTLINITLKEQSTDLNQVVVVGYGTQLKKDITGSIASISENQIKDLPITNFEQALKGQVAGVQVFQNSGSPSSGVTVKIRGNSSITAGNEPLYVIDGFPITGGSQGQGAVPNSGNPLNNINPSDIESIDILKDASATAIYGSRGANGVVIITTKSGKAGQSTLTFTSTTSFQSVSKKLDVLSAEEFAEYHIESRNNGWLQNKGNPATPNASRGKFAVAPLYFNPSQWVVTDWQNEVLRNGLIQNHNLSASGGTDKFKYAVSGGYLDNKGVIIQSGLKRYSVRANIDSKITEKLRLGFQISPSYTINNMLKTDGQFRQGLVGMALRLAPIVGPYLPDGSYQNPLAIRDQNGIGSLGAVDNPVAVANEDQYNLNQSRILGNVFLEFSILKSLKFRTSLGTDVNFNRTHVFISSKTGRSGTPPPNIASGSASSSQELSWLNENLLTYQTTFNTQHRITAIGGFSAQKNDLMFMRVDGTNYPSDNVPYLQSAGIVQSGTETRTQFSILSYFTRLNYSFKDRYLLTATLRRDGSSRFGPENKYGTFPSVALAWQMNEESFMKDLSIIDNLKWRLSYGKSGNNSIPNYAHVPNVVNIGYALGANQTVVNATATGKLANPFVTWETKHTLNLGLDLGLLKNRISLTADIYKSNTDGLLLDVNIPAVAGFTSTLENIGEIENRGVELGLSTINFDKAFKWNSSLNISFNRNKVIALGGSAGDFLDSGPSRTQVGMPVGLFYLRVTDGIFNTTAEIASHAKQDNAPQPGDRRFKDVNGDGVVNNNDLDFVGDPNPDFTFGISNTFSFKRFDLSTLMNGSYGNDINYAYAVGANLNGNLNQDGVVRGRWRSPENPGTGNIPKALFGFTNLADVNSDFYISDGSFLRLSNVTLGYNIPLGVINRLKLKGARISISGQNLLTLTKYPGFDPEIAGSGGNTLSFGTDDGIYPMAKSFTMGLNVSF